MPVSYAVRPRKYVEVNPPQRRTSGWLASADVRDVSVESMALHGGAEYVTDSCIVNVGGQWIDACLNPGVAGSTTVAATPTTPASLKSFDGPHALVTGDPFTVFAGSECLSPSFNEVQARASALARLSLIEARQVDFAIAANLTANGNDLGDCPLSQMIANAEYAAVLEYGGWGLIAMSAPLFVCAAQQGLIYPCPPDICAPGAHQWRTANGTYATAIAQDDRVTVKNFFLTGQVTLLRGPESAHTATEVADNNTRALAERVYVPLIECMAYYGTATCDAPVTT